MRRGNGMLKNVVIIANPGSGKGLAPDYASELSQVLKSTHSSKIELRETTEVGDAEEWAKSAKSEGFDTVICLGGDGTVNEVINGLMAVKEPPVFSFVPIGTANDLGRVLGFDMNPDQAVEQFKDMKEDTIDIGQVNDKYFMDVVAVGDIPTAVMETESEKKNKFGFFAYVLDGLKALVDGDLKKYQIKNSAGNLYEVNSHALLVAMTSSIGGAENLIEHREYNDGFFQFVALKGNLLESTIATLVNDGGVPKGLVDDDNLLAFSDDFVSIELMEENLDEKIYSNVDGDEGPVLPLKIRIHKQALKVLRPRIQED